MPHDPDPGVLDRNLSRLVRRWADPVSSEQTEASCREFLRRLAPEPAEGSRTRAMVGRISFAAILLLCGVAFWVLLSRTRPPPESPAVDSRPAQEDGGALKRRSEEREKEAAAAAAAQGPAALCWLARHQNPDGGWGAASFSNQCRGLKCSGPGDRDYDSGETALALLAFLGGGYSQMSKDEYADTAQPGSLLKFGDVCKKALQWLLAHQDQEGCVGERGPKYIYNHAIAALCLAEAYGLTASPKFKEPAQKAIDFLVAAQNPGKGWRYSPRSGDNDTSVTCWAVLALCSAQEAELSFPKAVFDGALAWLDEVTEQNEFQRAGYNARGAGKVFIPGQNESFDHHETMTAMAIVARIFVQRRKTDQIKGALNLLIADLPEWKRGKIDFYYWHFGSLAVYQAEGLQGPKWKLWNDAMKTALVPNQKAAKDGCLAGSWDPEHERWGLQGGRVYVTAMNALTLETYYRYPLVFGGK
jgi:hypothetical protein